MSSLFKYQFLFCLERGGVSPSFFNNGALLKRSMALSRYTNPPADTNYGGSVQ